MNTTSLALIGYRPLWLTLAGFTGVQRGMGLERLDLDLRTVAPLDDPTPRLVAVLGPNGRGKSTVLDNLHPYLTMPSRCDDPSAAFTYYGSVCAAVARKVFVWLHCGWLYRAEVVVRASGRAGRTEAFLQRSSDLGLALGGDFEAAAWEPVALVDGTRCDGKLDVYRRAVGEVLMPPQRFFLSEFVAQGQRMLSQLKTGEVKDVLASALDLGSIARQAERAGDVAKQLRSAHASQRASLATLGAQMDSARREQDAARGAAAALDVAATGARLDAARAALQAAHESLAVARSQEAAGEAARLNRERLSSALRAAEQQVRSREREHAAALDESRRAVEAIACQRRSDEAAMQREQADLRAMLASLAQQRRAERLARAAGRALAGRGRAKEQAASAAQALEAAARRRQRIERLLASLGREKALAQQRAGEITLARTGLERRCSLVGRVPCAGSALAGQCELLSDSRHAGAQLVQADEQIERLGRRARKLQSLAERCTARLEPSRLTWAGDLEHARSALDVARDRLHAAERLAASRGAPADGQLDAAEVLRRLEQMPQRLVSLAHEAAQREAACRHAGVSRGDEIGALLARDRAQVEELRAALAALPADASAQALEQASAAVDAAQATVQAAQQRAEQALAAQERLARSGALLHSLDEQHRQMLAREQALAASVGQWSLLAQGLGSKGVIALLIDEAGPAIAELANSILRECYGSRFSVSLSTLVETASGESREGFEILVSDAHQDSPCLLQDMSGGERIWINDALKRAVSLHARRCTGSARGAGAALVSDETDGALDPEHKRRLMQAKRHVLALGGYGVEFFVTHTPELSDSADATIDLDALVARAALAA